MFNAVILVVMASSVMDGVGRAVVGVWRAHTVLDESDGPDSSPEVPDHFRKLRSTSSLNSLRMTLRKRLPLRSVQTNSLPENQTQTKPKEQPKPSTMRKLTRSARNSVTDLYQVRFLETTLLYINIWSFSISSFVVCFSLSLSLLEAAKIERVFTWGLFGSNPWQSLWWGGNGCFKFSHSKVHPWSTCNTQTDPEIVIQILPYTRF